MRRLSPLWLAACVLLAAAPSAAGTIARCVKPYGGTAFVDGNVLTGAQLNCDFDAIYNEFNGSIGAANLGTGSVASDEILDATIVDADVSGSANIDPGKLGDYSAAAGEMATSTNPGTTGAESLATTLEGELERLRFAIARLAIGTNADGSAAAAWFDGPIQAGNNPVYNGSFEATDGTGTTGANDVVPAGWTEIGTPTEFYVDPVDVSEGEGVGLRLTATGAANEGVSQTLASLKASRVYLAIARVNPTTAGDTCDLRVTAAVEVFDVTATGTNVYETLSVLFTTTAVPAAVVVRLESNADTDICDFDHVGVFEVNADPVPQPGIQVVTQFTNTSTALTTAFAGAPNPILTRALTPPTPAQIVNVTAAISVESSGGNNNRVYVRLQENGVTVAMSQCGQTSNNAADSAFCTVPLLFVRENPTPGTTLTYTVDARAETGNAGTLNPLADGEQLSSRLVVELMPTR